ncbi:MAG: putative ubiquitin-RnfH superfamily antitoxin RatB of RatAB toxin-antitoxin module [Halopseudomonas sp.]|jgi:putative ubiquitin-RnfH superfamily antitoxin RatB of RatAB toxin-antitoxin module|uniref:RnfH family protein n=1 Tax=Halopseudomonas sp. TaxID=2901191 RepID=UPI0039E43FEA
MVVEVAYALPHKQKILSLSVSEGATVRQAVIQSGIDTHFPEVDVQTCAVGVFGKAVTKPEERVLNSGERIEIYRPLIADPKEIRKQRAVKSKAAKEG